MMMRGRNRGFKLGRKITRVFRWVTRKRGKSCNYERLELEGPIERRNKAISKLCRWGKKIQRGILNSVKTRGYVRVGNDSDINSKSIHVPKGHLAVHVEEPEGDTRRVMVPVLFLNHPLFGKLLEEAENVYGYHHPGQITIPCPISEFENVQTKIASVSGKCRPRVYRPGHISGVRCLSL
ncbi:Auxin-responsive protein SAUR36 [Bienertia sinuspersici]